MSRELITLCGSTRFRDEFREVERVLTLEGRIPLPPAIYGKAEGIGEYSEKMSKHLFDLHLEKIRISSGIFVIDVDGYMGGSTQKEIDFAKQQGIESIRYYSKEKDYIKRKLKELEVEKNE